MHSKGIGINIMFASQFAELVNTALEEGIDLIIRAGFQRFFKWCKSKTPFVSIVSTAKLAKISQG